MPINEIPYSPTHAPDTYIPDEDEPKIIVSPYAKGGITSSMYPTGGTTSPSRVLSDFEKVKNELVEEHEKRIRAESVAEVLKVRLENSEDNKEDDEDEISRLESELSHLKKIHRDVTFILADSAAGPVAVQGHTTSSYRSLVQQILTALKQEPRKM